MNKIIQINQTEDGIRVFYAGSHLSFIEDWNKTSKNFKDNKRDKEQK
ncbi:MAG: hypothetical protein IMY72_13595 [Bacteroidetes bacterium]|nr:hypothetical protein [Bacteroidota bacterium]